MAHVGKAIRETLLLRLNGDATLTALGLKFESGVWPDAMGRAIDALALGAKRGFVVTHPETAPDTKQPNVRLLEVHVIAVCGGGNAETTADTLDEAQEAIEDEMDSDATIGGLTPGGCVFSQVRPGVDAQGQRFFGIRWITYQAGYARRRKA